MRISIPISPGDLLDKISILEIKSARIGDAAKLANVHHELELLEGVWRELDVETDEVRALRGALRAINERLWEIEDAIRGYEARADFSPQFIELARSVYRENDERARIKRRINEQLSSEIVEEKSYSKY